jgi:hypothetical protein
MVDKNQIPVHFQRFQKYFNNYENLLTIRFYLYLYIMYIPLICLNIIVDLFQMIL